MKKFILTTLSLILISFLISCSAKTPTVSESIEEFFNKVPSDEKVVILLTKDVDNQKLVLAERKEKEGEQYTTLFLLNEKNEILSFTNGRKPISPCFTVNTLIHNNKRIIFGSFNDSKWVPSEDKKIKVDISKIDITLTDNTNIIEDVILDEGYIVITDNISDIKDVNVLNDKDEIQSTLDDFSNIVDKTEFIEYKE